VDILLLGSVEVWQDDKRINLGHARQRCVLAALSTGPRRLVPTTELIDRLWSGAPPEQARQTLHAYVSRTRRALGISRGTTLQYRRGGYALEVDESAIDLFRFRHLVSRARRALAAGEGPRAAPLFEDALRLWRGDALSDLEGHWADGVRARLAEERFAAMEDRLDVDLELGRHASVVGELTALVREFPWRERIVGQLMIALYRDGRQSDALRAYSTISHQLASDGLRPGPGLRQVEERILRDDIGIG
jgi:DNA-binding SARP family transcriptional activator